MKKSAYCFTIAGALFFASCGAAEATEGTATTEGTTETTTTPTVEVPKLVVNEADWVEKDLSTVASLVYVSMKVPKDAKIAENGNGAAEISVTDYYIITVEAAGVSTAKQAMDDVLSLANTSYQNIQVLVQEDNGMIYTQQMKNEAYGITYQPEIHFAYFTEKDGSVFSVKSGKSLNAWDTPGSAFSEDAAKKIYNIVKSSVKIN